MADNKKQDPNQEYSDSVKADAYKLAVDRAFNMSKANEQASAIPSSQISPDPTPSRKVMPDSTPASTLHLQDRFDNFPKQEQTSIPKYSFQDVKDIGKTLQQQGVISDNPSQSEETKNELEKGFDKDSDSSKSERQLELLNEDITKKNQQLKSIEQNIVNLKETKLAIDRAIEQIDQHKHLLEIEPQSKSQEWSR